MDYNQQFNIGRYFHSHYWVRNLIKLFCILSLITLLKIYLFGNESIIIDTKLEIYHHKPTKLLPNCIIIGARKSGTRALLDFLGLHPEISIAAQETHFFDNDTLYEKGFEFYKSQMPQFNPKKPHVSGEYFDFLIFRVNLLEITNFFSRNWKNASLFCSTESRRSNLCFQFKHKTVIDLTKSYQSIDIRLYTSCLHSTFKKQAHSGFWTFRHVFLELYTRVYTRFWAT